MRWVRIILYGIAIPHFIISYAEFPPGVFGGSVSFLVGIVGGWFAGKVFIVIKYEQANN